MTTPVSDERLGLIASGIADRLAAGASAAPDLERDIASAITELLALRAIPRGGVSVERYQCREIGEGGWEDCSKEKYDRLALDPHYDTRILSAIEQEQEPVAFEGLAKRKLDDLIARGWNVAGYAIQNGEMRYGFITTGGFVGWWLPDDYLLHTTDTPLQDQEPVAWQRVAPDGTIELTRSRSTAAGWDRSENFVRGLYASPSVCEGKVTHPDDLAVDRFAAAVKAKLAKKRSEGRGGWDRKDECSAEFLSQLLREHVEKGDPVDVGNLAMMLQQRGERITK